MAHRSRDRSAGTAKSASGKKTDSPFKALSALKGSLGTPSAPRTPTRPARKEVAQTGREAAEDDPDLLRRALTGVAPLGRQDRAEVEPPRPAPVRRPQPAESEPARAAPRRNEDPLSAAYADVTPIADTGRIELTRVRRRTGGPAGSAADTDRSADDSGALPAVILPADADLTDPASLFRLAARGAQRIDSKNRVELAGDAPLPAPIKREADEREALSESLTAPLTFEDRLEMGDEPAFLRPGLPRRVLTDLRRGRWVLQGELDLHGLTRDEAREALAHFLAQSLLQGKRCIRVIHGKGLGSPGKVSILKQLSRGWLAQREEILAFCQAGPHDGGGGALLVLMRASGGARR